MSETLLTGMLAQMLPRLWAFALRLCGDPSDAEFLIQRACMYALECERPLHGEAAPLIWMFSLIRSTWHNELHPRHAHGHSVMERDDGCLESLARAGKHASEKPVTDASIVDAVQRLPENQRIALLLVDVEGLRYRDAAEVLDVPFDVVVTLLTQARKTTAMMCNDRDQISAWRALIQGSNFSHEAAADPTRHESGTRRLLLRPRQPKRV